MGRSRQTGGCWGPRAAGEPGAVELPALDLEMPRTGTQEILMSVLLQTQHLIKQPYSSLRFTYRASNLTSMPHAHIPSTRIADSCHIDRRGPRLIYFWHAQISQGVNIKLPVSTPPSPPHCPYKSVDKHSFETVIILKSQTYCPLTWVSAQKDHGHQKSAPGLLLS